MSGSGSPADGWPDPEPLGREVVEALDGLAGISDAPPGLTRLYLSPAHRRALDRIGAWMAAAGCAVSLDAAGTLVGRLPGRDPDAPALLLGSHQDSVRDAGRFDGPLGIVVPLVALRHLRAAGWSPPAPIEVLAFGDEEGTRFGQSLFGSRALAGGFDPADLALADADGVTLDAALRGFGLDPDAIPALARDPAGVAGFVEVHIEQAPRLQARGLPLGVVSGIVGSLRDRITVTGRAGHAGTEAMADRRDALAAAAEMVLAVERMAADTAGLRATVGRLEATPGAINVVPGRACFALDLRCLDDTARARHHAELSARLQEIAARRSVALDRAALSHQPSAHCDPELTRRLCRALEADGWPAPGLESGAGHDAMAMAGLCPTAMLFVRCRDGLSHSPAEHVDPTDAGRAVRTMMRFLSA